MSVYTVTNCHLNGVSDEKNERGRGRERGKGNVIETNAGLPNSSQQPSHNHCKSKLN